MTKQNKLIIPVTLQDPTGKIPANHIFLTGFQEEHVLGDCVFITRSPCIKASDGRRIRVVTNKPDHMTEKDYIWLKSMPFGVAIFGLPVPGNRPAPTMIASGDLYVKSTCILTF